MSGPVRVFVGFAGVGFGALERMIVVSLTKVGVGDNSWLAVGASVTG